MVTVNMNLEWHPVSEKPESGKAIMVIVQSSKDYFWYATTSWTGPDYGGAPITAWAYIPNAGKLMADINTACDNKHFNSDFVHFLHDNALNGI
jgi:hypothetical protein